MSFYMCHIGDLLLPKQTSPKNKCAIFLKVFYIYLELLAVIIPVLDKPSQHHSIV